MDHITEPRPLPAGEAVRCVAFDVWILDDIGALVAAVRDFLGPRRSKVEISPGPGDLPGLGGALVGSLDRLGEAIVADTGSPQRLMCPLEAVVLGMLVALSAQE